MEWLVLLLVVPAIVMPVVLLCGFAGCHFAPAPVTGNGGNGGSGSILAPTSVMAVPKNVDHITVSWQKGDPNTTGYQFVRNGGTPETISDTSMTIKKEDIGLAAATDYTYTVSTITGAGNADAGPVPAHTFQAAFDVRSKAATPQPNFMGANTYVQRISAGNNLLASGATVGIKVRGAPASNITINGIYISRAGAGQKWDSAGDLTPVITSPLTLPNAQPVDLEPIAYNLDKSQDLIIAFDFTAAPGADTMAYVSPLSGVTSYFKPGVLEASVPKDPITGEYLRSPGYSTGPSQIYLVATIGVP